MEYENIDTIDDELTHWGIKGMRWGIRRYQNKDGSLTPAGKRKLKAENDKLKAEEQVLKNRKATKAKLDKLAAKRKALEDQKKELDSDDPKTKKAGTDASKTSKKSIKDMSDDELVSGIRRAQLEQQYSSLTAQPETTTRGNSFVKDFWHKAAVPAIQEAGKGLIKDSLTKLGKKYLGLDTENADDYVQKLGKEVKKMTLEKQYRKLKEEFAEETAKNQSSSDGKTQKKETTSDDSKTTSSTKSKDSKSNVVIGEIISGGRTQNSSSSQTAKKATYDIIDAEFVDVTTSNAKNYPATQRGQSYITGLLPSTSQLALPSPKDDD